MAVDALSAAKLAIYIILVQPTFFILWKHGLPGLLGWLYLNLFCVLRIVTDAMTLHPNTSTATLILASIGMAPLLFACAGILHEARLARDPRVNPKMEWILQLQFHAVVIGATVLVIVGVVKIEGKDITEATLHTSQSLVKAGAAIIVLAFIVLAIWSILSMRTRGTSDVPSYRGGSILLHAILATLPFNGIRLIYSVTSLILRTTHPTSGFLTSTAASVCLSVVPEILVVIILIVGGLRTYNLRQTVKTMTKYDAQPMQTGMQPMLPQYPAHYTQGGE
ncbi:hypothetical protein SBRCBS47491_009695 [Sporothrix bragantina]|uniref:DUF7702 domain-containing protein n=1 Tax=Sporothrix bragantina TaxID=671064 RepID=A0ABP0CWT3_9PEZI